MPPKKDIDEPRSDGWITYIGPSSTGVDVPVPGSVTAAQFHVDQGGSYQTTPEHALSLAEQVDNWRLGKSNQSED